MARITYNNIQGAQNLITFTDIPNIIKIDDGQGGSCATFTIAVGGDWRSSTSTDGQWYITFLGETITNVLDPKNAVNKNFYIASSTDSTVASMVRAFRNCPSLSAMFNIEMSGGNVQFTARQAGTVWTGQQNYFQTNAVSYISTSASDGSASPLNGCLIDVDVYSDSNYITTLEKTMYDGICSFNVSPVLTSISKEGATVPYNFKISTLDNGNYSVLGNIEENHSAVGFMCNQGAKYLDNNYFNIAQNYYRGTSREPSNNTLLYTYFPRIPISVYKGNSAGATITIDYLDSAFNIITSQTISWSAGWQVSKLYDINLDLNVGAYSFFNQAFYIDISFGNTAKIRYDVIKPIKATEYCQRILWRNSYGGISFFDFTGQRSETRELETMTYEKNIFDYYTDDMNEIAKMYDNKVEYVVSLKSHLFAHDGKYIFNDLIQSPFVWTEINGQKYAIIIDSVSVDETDRNDIYEATVRYKYSAEPSLI